MRGLRVLELAGSVAGAYCARLFVTTGADVVLVEPAAGAPTRARGPIVEDVGGATRSAFHEYLDAGKRSVQIDVDGRDGDDALRWADLVILTVDGDPERAEALRTRISRLSPRTVLAVVSGFGLTGPYATWRNSDLVDWASGGYLYISGDPGRAPLQGGGPWASLLTGATAAVGAAVAVIDAARTGIGQLVDVANMEAVASAHQWSLTMYTHTGVVKQRAGLRFENYHPLSIYASQDGWILIAAPDRSRFEAVCIVCEAWQLLTDEALGAPAARFDRADEVDEHIRPWLSAHTVDEAVDALQAHRVPTAKLNTFSDVLESDQLAARHMWAHRSDIAPAARMPRSPFRFGAEPPTPPGEAPGAIGADTEWFLAEARLADPSTRPRPHIDLADVRVAEFSIAWAGPLAGRFLADFGVHVVKVEHPTSRGIPTEARRRLVGAPGWTWGDPVDPQIRAEIFPGADPGERFWNRSGIWNKMNRGKRSLAVEAKHPAGRDVLDRLLASVDVVLHNFSPRGAASLGIDAAAVLRHNPNAVTVAMTGFGSTGPMASHVAFGPILEAYGGLDAAMGYIGEGPHRLGFAYADAVGGVHGAYATLAALWDRGVTGSSVHVDLSQLETLISMVGEALLSTSVTGRPPERMGNRSIDHAPQGVYRCSGDDRWIAITVTNDASWRDLVDLVADAALAPFRSASVDVRFEHHGELDEALSAWLADQDAHEAATRLQALGIPACPAFSTRDLVDDPHLRARRFMVQWDQVDVGVATFPGYPIHFERRTYEVIGAPGLGADNTAILEELGFEAPEIRQLWDEGVVADRPPD